MVVYECGMKSRSEHFSNHTHTLCVCIPFVFRLQLTADHLVDAFFEVYRVGSSQMMKAVVGRAGYLIRSSDLSLC